MEDVHTRGLTILSELMLRLSALTPDQYRAPVEKRKKRMKKVGKATDYQKALVTLKRRVEREHERLHKRLKLDFGGHINLPAEHEFLHAAPELIYILLVVNLSNTFKELSAPVDFYISRKWKVYVVRPRKKKRRSN